jgi:flagellar basal-body rod protein FlgF
MSSELYSSWSGANAAWKNLEVISSNIANASTTGFRSERVRYEEVAGMVQASGGGYDSSDGALIPDGIDTHLALRGEGFFALSDGTYTRDGSFKVAADGQLVSASGVPVLTDGGTVQLSPGESLQVDQDGTVRGSESGDLGQLKIVSLSGGTPLGKNLWSAASATKVTGEVVQGSREGSNVDPMRCLVDLMEATRSFEAQQKAMQASDDASARLNRMQE